jgi:2-polyprenyl-3-methyl-5-hydroxy-6-metoxy-1,4-benzoquinol methylase
MVEIWPRLKQEEAYILEHLTRVKERRMACAHDRVDIVPRKFRSNGLPEMHTFDAVYCTSMLLKLGEVELAFEDMCSLVKPGGMLFPDHERRRPQTGIRVLDEKMYMVVAR